MPHAATTSDARASATRTAWVHFAGSAARRDSPLGLNPVSRLGIRADLLSNLCALTRLSLCATHDLEAVHYKEAMQ